MPDVAGDQETVARAALAEISPPGTVGELLGRAALDDGVSQLNFASTLSGYPGWHWSVSVAEVSGEPPTVLEAELMPGDGALLAPEWVPWAERLEDYRAAQAALAAEHADSDEDADDDDESDDDSDDDDFEDLDDDELSGVSAGGVDEQSEPEDETADDGPEQPDEA